MSPVRKKGDVETNMKGETDLLGKRGTDGSFGSGKFSVKFRMTGVRLGKGFLTEEIGGEKEEGVSSKIT